jgi:hypothetical protein
MGKRSTSAPDPLSARPRGGSRVGGLRAFGWRAVVLAVAAVIGGCSVQAAEPPKGPVAAGDQGDSVEADPSALPAVLESLHPSAAQRAELLALRDELEDRLEPLADAGRELALGVASAARRCNADMPVLESATTWAVRAGDQARPTLLDAIDRLHAILTPAQRKALADRLLGREQESQSTEPTDEGARAFGDTMDLSVGQMFRLLTRALALRSALEERIAPWREKARSALAAFPDDHFVIREHAIAEVPAVAIGTRFLRDALGTIFPILEPEQCVALAGLIEQAVEEEERRARRRDSAGGVRPD